MKSKCLTCKLKDVFPACLPENLSARGFAYTVDKKHPSGFIVFEVTACGKFTNDETKIHLCDTCKRESPSCLPRNVEFGTGIGSDNVIKCTEYLPEGGKV